MILFISCGTCQPAKPEATARLKQIEESQERKKDGISNEIFSPEGRGAYGCFVAERIQHAEIQESSSGQIVTLIQAWDLSKSSKVLPAPRYTAAWCPYRSGEERETAGRVESSGRHSPAMTHQLKKVALKVVFSLVCMHVPPNLTLWLWI